MQRPISETVEREERVVVLRPVVETTQQQERVIVRKAVVETSDARERVIVRRPVYETAEREERRRSRSRWSERASATNSTSCANRFALAAWSIRARALGPKLPRPRLSTAS